MSMPFWPVSTMPGCLRAGEARLSGGIAWRMRGRTLYAMALLCVARLLVKLVPFDVWCSSLGKPDPRLRDHPRKGTGAAPQLARHVERGAARLPFATKCLPRAMALCWLLRRAGAAYTFKIAARPATLRGGGMPGQLPASPDALHAWVESDNVILINALPGPWLEVLVLFG